MCVDDNNTTSKLCMFRVCMFRMLFCISCELVPEVEAMMIPVEALLAFFGKVGGRKRLLYVHE